MVPPDETKRLEALYEFGILDTPSESAFDDIVELASAICGMPIAAISLVDESRGWFKAIHGLAADALPRDLAFCSHTILDPDLIFEVPDLSADSRFATNPLVTDGPKLRFYAGAPLISPSGHALGSVCVASPELGKLTDSQRRALRALSRQTVSLFQLKRTLRQSEQQAQELRTAHEAVQTASRAKDNFLAGIGHELRTPLNGVVGLGESLLHDPDAPNRLETITLINRSGRALMRLVDDLLEFSNEDDPMGAFRPQVFRPAALAAEVLDLYRPEARQKGIDLELEGQKELSVEADPTRLRRVLIHLVDNAVKFTREGGITVTLALVGPSRLRGEVRDTGIGYKGEATPFAGFDQGHRRRHSGVGLGLETTAKIVHRLGGRFAIEPGKREGTLAWFEVPVKIKSSVTIPLVPGDMDWAGKRVLVVEDNAVNVMVIRTIMERMGMAVTIAANGSDAIESVDSDGYDLILMDVQMPEMDGIEAARRIRHVDAEVPIVAVTASSVESDRRACREAGMQGYLVKPITEESLRAEISAAVASLL